MAGTLALILLVASFLLLLTDAFSKSNWRVNLQSLGLACLVGAMIFGGIALPFR